MDLKKNQIFTIKYIKYICVCSGVLSASIQSDAKTEEKIFYCLKLQ